MTRTLGTVEYTIRLMLGLAEPPGLWGVTELAERLGLSKSSVSAALATLKRYGFVEQDPETRRYRLGWGLHNLAYRAFRGVELRFVALPHMRRLADQLGESVYLNVPNGNVAVVAERVDPQAAVRVTMEVGSVAPLHASAGSKAILAFWSREEVDRLIREAGLRSVARNTITSAAELFRELERVRARGYAVSEEELFEGVAGIAAPIFGPDLRVLGSLEVAGLTPRIVPRLQEIAELVLGAASLIQADLGAGGVPTASESMAKESVSRLKI